MDRLMSYENLQALCIARGDALIEANAKLIDTMRDNKRLRLQWSLAKDYLDSRQQERIRNDIASKDSDNG